MNELFLFLAEAIHSQHDNFLTLCIRHKVKKLYAFGSVITTRFDYIHSDILVEITKKDPILKGDLLLELQLFFERKVDLLTDQPIKNKYLKASVDNSKVLIYDGDREEVLLNCLICPEVNKA